MGGVIQSEVVGQSRDRCQQRDVDVLPFLVVQGE
jgi:hypothetical protein